MHCYGAFTRWGGYNDKWLGGYTTQVDIYLDAAYATANPDTYGGNLVCLVPTPTDVACNGTRFDYTSAINNSSGAHRRDFGFNVSTGLANDGCTGFMVVGTTNVDRIGANPNSNPDAKCIPTSGWYTFKHTFSDVGGNLQRRLSGLSVRPIPSRKWAATGTAGSRTRRSGACRSTTRR